MKLGQVDACQRLNEEGCRKLRFLHQHGAEIGILLAGSEGTDSPACISVDWRQILAVWLKGMARSISAFSTKPASCCETSRRLPFTISRGCQAAVRRFDPSSPSDGSALPALRSLLPAVFTTTGAMGAKDLPAPRHQNPRGPQREAEGSKCYPALRDTNSSQSEDDASLNS